MLFTTYSRIVFVLQITIPCINGSAVKLTHKQWAGWKERRAGTLTQEKSNQRLKNYGQAEDSESERNAQGQATDMEVYYIS